MLRKIVESGGMRKLFGQIAKQILSRAFRRFPGVLASSLRMIVARDTFKNQDTLSSGIFEGAKFRHLAWNSSDKASILSGSYEHEVQSWLSENITRMDRDVINIGAGDGLYAVGLLHSGFAARVFCFETNPQSRKLITKNATLNNLQEEHLVVQGTFNNIADSLSTSLKDFRFNDSLFIVDVEGAEFEILSPEFFEIFRSSAGLVEIHDPQGQKAAELKLLAETFYDVKVIKTQGRDPMEFPALAKLSDDFRWGVMSEGRSYPGQWFGLTPKQLELKT